MIRELARDVLAGAMPWWTFVPFACGVVLLAACLYELAADVAAGRRDENPADREARRVARERRRERARIDEARAAADLYPRDRALDVIPLNVTPKNSTPAGCVGRGA